MTEPKFDKGPAEVVRAVAEGHSLEEFLAFQRESFRAKFGCYPEECTVVPVEEMTVEDVRAMGGHPSRPDAR